MKTKKIDWGRRVNRPRVTKRVKKPPREAYAMEKRMLCTAALLKTLPDNKITISALTEIFGVLHYPEAIPTQTGMRKAMPTLRRLIRLNEVADWTK